MFRAIRLFSNFPSPRYAAQAASSSSRASFCSKPPTPPKRYNGLTVKEHVGCLVGLPLTGYCLTAIVHHLTRSDFENHSFNRKETLAKRHYAATTGAIGGFVLALLVSVF